MTNTTHNVVKFSQDSAGKFVGVLTNSNPLLAQREPHGIKYEKDEKDGREYFYHTNPGWNDWWPVEPPSATENLLENTDGGWEHPISVLSGRYPATF